MYSKRDRRCGAYIGILIGLAIGMILVSLNGCTMYHGKATNSDGTMVSALVLYPPGKKLVQPRFKYNRDGEAVGLELGADDSAQPGPQDYAAGVAAGIGAILGAQDSD